MKDTNPAPVSAEKSPAQIKKTSLRQSLRQDKYSTPYLRKGSYSC